MIDCKKLAEDIKNDIKKSVLGKVVTLTVIQVGNDKPSNSYITGKRNDCEEVGIGFNHIHLQGDCKTEDVISVIDLYNNIPACKGIIVQLPLPKHLDVPKIMNRINIEKDVDGFNPRSEFIGCTPAGILEILKYIGKPISGSDIVVVGRGSLVGKPITNLLIDYGGTVTCCNSKTKDLKKHTLRADIIITATGKKGLIRKDMVRREQTIIDAGIFRDFDGKLYGDCDKSLYNFVDNITTVPGGVGLLTRVCLLKNTIKNL